MEGFLQWWTGDPWLIFISLVGGGVGVALILRWRAWPVQRRLLALAVIVLVLHVWEEWRFPGGLHYAYNYLAGSTDAYALARYPMSELTDMLTNVGGVLAGTAALIWAGRSTVTAITVWVVCVVEVLLHLGLGIAAFGVFGTVYDPGLATALLGFLPLAIAYGVVIFRRLHPSFKQWLFGILATAAVLVLFIKMPELLFADPRSSYPFDSPGFYDYMQPD